MTRDDDPTGLSHSATSFVLGLTTGELQTAVERCEIKPSVDKTFSIRAIVRFEKLRVGLLDNPTRSRTDAARERAAGQPRAQGRFRSPRDQRLSVDRAAAAKARWAKWRAERAKDQHT